MSEKPVRVFGEDFVVDRELFLDLVELVSWPTARAIDDSIGNFSTVPRSRLARIRAALVEAGIDVERVHEGLRS